MANPIKETPFLHGKDAQNFIEENKNIKKISKEEKDEILKNYNELISISDCF